MNAAVWGAAAGYVAAMIQWAIADIRRAKREAAVRIAEAKANCMVGLCTSQCPPAWRGSPAIWCELGHGHTGSHGNKTGTTRWIDQPATKETTK